MEKIKFAVQIAVLIFAFPVYFFAEVNHGKKTDAKEHQVVKTENRYTKNGKDKECSTPVQQSSVYTNTIFINSFN